MLPLCASRRHIFGGGARAAAGRLGRLGRGRAAAAAAKGTTADDDAQQEVTVLMMQQLPQLLKLYQAEPLVVSVTWPICGTEWREH